MTLNLAPTRGRKATTWERTGQFLPANWRATHALSRTRLLVPCAVEAGILMIAPSAVVAQTNGSSGNTGTNTEQHYQSAGVAIDADGVLRVKTFSDPGGQLMRERIAAAKATLDPKVASFSKLRKISLNRLEQAILDHQGTLTDEMRNLAGLLRVRYVFYYPESKDIVLAGPAEGWVADPAGRVVGISTRPARRAVAGSGRGVAGVSARRRQDPADRLLDRSDAGRSGRHAAVPARAIA